MGDAKRDIGAVLGDSLTRRGIAQWWQTPNRLLNGRRPLDAIADGDRDGVREAADAFDAGTYQ
ncbi:DUF2384 domain-containing protein [Egibacter rhizosphaerae]|uniref:DUF2384 domain-containing protein n=1 Tax=Egibacter rhizosphaerae TaxID=1670831 RepID=A0A411YCA3_9ACTN|nr:antitoxin Xre/MbcA/ParS toxin-binding domain-containing protein [Egibacter rhizosphaerae]QBI18871.1 DUF2384 domain-containing protein [Egibacter rhizosphaerae]